MIQYLLRAQLNLMIKKTNSSNLNSNDENNYNLNHFMIIKNLIFITMEIILL